MGNGGEQRHYERGIGGGGGKREDAVTVGRVVIGMERTVRWRQTIIIKVDQHSPLVFFFFLS